MGTGGDGHADRDLEAGGEGHPDPDEVEVTPVGPGDQMSFDLLRWSRSGAGAVPDAEELLRGLYRRVTAGPVDSTLGTYLCSPDSDQALVATGSTASHEWIADRYQLPLRPRKEPWLSLREQAGEVHRVHCAEWVDVALWAHWRGGVRVREVQLGLSQRPVVRGTLQEFERPLWDGVAPDPQVEPRLEPVPEDERIDVRALIAAEPPGSLQVREDGRRLLFITSSLPVEDGIVQLPPGRGTGSGFTIEGADSDGGDDVVRPFVDLDTLNHIAVWDEDDDAWVDQTALVRAALQEWLGLTGHLCGWDWPCQVWTVRR